MWVRDVESFYNFIGYVVLRAPDNFPKEDYLAESEQMNLEKAFEELRAGIKLVQADFPDKDKASKLRSLLDESLSYYRTGDEVKAAHLLQDFQDSIFRT